ncbi:hypothetical protein GOP47_0023184 [Adiantum capillus-veneris]|uniref:CAAX prenyl protease 2/Lysostaphin resistance protein A-like domain-containing protein n=1 Tax=Adiantum capillus-veneris TaxID=13818 RepID=A0A9D4U788_ADICA|nr:hypothetical protein GOP47_0023184 [Adiantum capillus-veneris]
MEDSFVDTGALEEPSYLQLQLHRHYLDHYYHPAFLRAFPWLLTVLSANLLHYSSLLQARAHARRLAMDSPPPLSFTLMNSPSMRLVRYKIKLLRYSATLIFFLLFWSFIPEIAVPLEMGWGTIEASIVGLLAGFITIYLNENMALNMRNPWKPAIDFQLASYGCMWDMLRLFGATLLVPFEEELFYHSWLYRYLCQLVSRERHYGSFMDVPFHEWNWGAWIAANGLLALYNGQEWKSYGISGLLCNWVIARKGQLMYGILAHSIRNLAISFWVLSTGQRQYW